VTVDGPSERLPLATDTEELVFRIGQEAVTNAVKHSGGQEVSVEVELAGPDVHMLIRDQGGGFDPSATYAGHLGLELMRSRTADAGGSIAIDSGRGAGTTVHVVVPSVATTARPAPPAPQAARPASVS
jgi:two-component system, NarL family, sensor histidine kinase DegS